MEAQISLAFSIVAAITCVYQAYKHLQYLSRPSIQYKLVGILLSVPIFSFTCTLSLYVPETSVYAELTRAVVDVSLKPPAALSLYILKCRLMSFTCLCHCSWRICEAAMMTTIMSSPTLRPGRSFTSHIHCISCAHLSCHAGSLS